MVFWVLVRRHIQHYGQYTMLTLPQLLSAERVSDSMYPSRSPFKAERMRDNWISTGVLAMHLGYLDFIFR